MRFFSAFRTANRFYLDLVALLLLIPILVMAWSLRSIHRADWDGYGALIHPDEYHVGDRVTTSLRVPDSFSSYLRTECPRVYNQATYEAAGALINPRNPEAPLKDQEPSATSGCNSLNPRSLAWNRGHVYGSLPTTLVRYAVEMFNPTTNPDAITRNQVVTAGRVGSTLADLLVIVLLYVMGRRLASRKVGLLAALLYAWVPFAIQQSHFYVVDSQAAAYGVLTLYFCLRLSAGGRWGAALGAGISLALAVASKINLAPMVLVIIVAALQAMWHTSESHGDSFAPLSVLGRLWRVFWNAFPVLALAGVAFFLAVRIAMPDAFRGTTFFDFRPDLNFVEALGAASFNSSGQLDFPPSHQWAGRTNYVYELRNMIVWAMGVPLGLTTWLSWGALGAGMLRRATRHLRRWLPLWFWVTFYFGWQGSLPLKSMRYLLPIYGPLVLFGAWGLVALWHWARQAERPRMFRRAPLQAIAVGLAALVVGTTVAWGWGFSRIYERPHPRIAAADWARRNIPPGSVVSSDAWDIGIPFLDGWIWPGSQIPVVSENDPALIETLIQEINKSNYLAFTSNRAYGSLPQLAMRFPATLNYFRGIFDGSLGFEKVADFSSFPSFLGIPISDELADEGWSVYDHPRVTIWRKTDAWSIDNARRVLGRDVNLNEIYKLKPIDATPMPTMLLLTVKQWLAQNEAGSWATIFNGVANRVPLLAWVLLVEIIGIATFGLLWRWRLPLPDRGLGMARLLGLLVLAFIAWLPPALHGWSFSRLWIALVFGGLVGVGGWQVWRERRAILAWAIQRRRALLTGQMIYWAAFGLLLLIRYLNPDLWHPAMGGEKPMNLAYLTATLKTESFPPYDPWFAGGYLNYYYWGYVLVGTPMKLLGLRPEIGFNLALPLLYGVSAQLAGSIGYNLLSTLRRTAARLERRAMLVAVATAIAVVLMGNLAQLVLYVNGARVMGNPALSFNNPEQSSQNLWLSGGSPFSDAVRGLGERMDGKPFPFRAEWPYWNATRIIKGTINEFPFFSFLYGDLHAHVIALPLTLLVVLLLVALWRGRQHSWWMITGLMAALGFVVGALRATNTWDYPTYAVLAVVGGLVIASKKGRGEPWRRRWGQFALVLGGLVAAMLLPWLPFTRYLATGSYEKLILVAGDIRMNFRDWLVIYGVWFWVLIPFGIVVARRVWSRQTALLVGGAALLWMFFSSILGSTLKPRDQYVPEGKIATLINDLILESLRQGGAAIIIVLPLFLVAVALLIAALRARTRSRDVLPLAWITAAFGLLLLSETVVLPGAGRMNVVFKFGYQAWVLLAVASTTALPTLYSIRQRRAAITAAHSPRSRRRVSSGLQMFHALFLMVLVAGALFYPLTATPAKIADRYVPTAPRGLDGMAWMDGATWNENGEFSLAPDAAAIRWMRQNIEGTPTVLEGVTWPYRWNARIATWTGLPTLIGWDGHQNQQRAPAQAAAIIGQRKNVVQQIYSAVDVPTARRLLDEYGVGVIYIGPLERNLYGGDAGATVFEQLGNDWRLAYNQQDAQIYLRTTRSPAPTFLPPRPEEYPGLPPADPVAAITLPAPVGTLPSVDGVADWAWLGQHQWAAIGLWLLVIELIGLLAWPIAALALRSHGAAAWGSSKIIGLLLFGWLIWLPLSLGLWRWTRLSVVVGLLMLGALSWAAWRHGAAARMRATWHHNRRALIATEAVFVGLFALWTLVRAANPDLWHPYWGGEKPFEYGFFNAVLRSPQMPPVDPFFSGGTINYYYYGLYLMALPLKLLGLDPAIGFNLAVAMVGALIGVGAWSVGLLVTRRLRVAAFVLIAVALIGNLASAIPVGSSSGVAGIVRAFQACDRPVPEARPGCAPVEGAAQVDINAALADAGRYGTTAGFSTRLGAGMPWFWGPSRVMVGGGLNTINEFPLWSIVFADLHPHLIALPITLLVVGLAWEASRRRRWRQQWAALALIPFAVGALAAANAWDVPTYGLLVVLALALRGWRYPSRNPRHGRAGLAGLIGWAGVGVGLVILGVGLYAPFFGTYRAPVGGIWPIRIGSPSLPWLAIYGLFLLILVGWLMLPQRRSTRNSDPFAAAYQGSGIVYGPASKRRSAAHSRPSVLLDWARRLQPRWVLPYVFGSVAVLVWYLRRSEPLTYKPIFAASFGVRLMLVALLALLVRRLLQRVNQPSARWAVLLATLGALVALGSEMVFVRDHLAPLTWESGPNESERMNTVFKFGYQVWVLWATAAALVLPRLLRGLRRVNVVAYGIWLGVLGFLVGAALIFPVFGIISRVGTRFATPPAGLTLDGLAFMRTASYGVNNGTVNLADDAAAIRWITANISGTPLLLQSEQEFYRAYGVRIAANTGLPTIVSALHANEQRPGPLVDARVRDVQRIYSGSDPLETAWLLNKYAVDYVYVGALERLRDPVGVQKFATLGGVRQVYQQGSVTIYQTTPQLAELARQWRPTIPQPEQPLTGTSPGQPATDPLAAALALYDSDPSNAGYAFDAAQKLWQNGQGDRAAGILRRAADLHPTDIGLHHLLGDILLGLGRYAEGVQAYNEGYLAGPTVQNLTKLGTGYMAWAAVDSAQLPEAERIFRQAIELQSDFSDPYYYLGETYRLMGNISEARAQYEAYLKLAPADGLWVEATRTKLKTLQ